MTYTIHTDSKCDIPQEIVSYDTESNEYRHKVTGEAYYGVAVNKGTSRYLFQTVEAVFSPKISCKLFRYSSQATSSGGMFPIISVNEERGLVYFWDSEAEKWETKGLKLDAICVLG